MKYAPFELNAGYMPAMIKEIRADDVILKGIRSFATQALQNLADAHNAIIEAQVFQTRAANLLQKSDPPLEERGSSVLKLPSALMERRINPTFHVSLLRPYHASNDALFPDRVQPEPYDFGAPDGQEWFVDELQGHRWIDSNLEFENVQMTQQNITAPFQTQQQPMGGFNTPQPFAQGQPFGFGGGFAPPQQQTLGIFSGQQQPPPNQPFGGFGAYPPPTNQQGYWGANQTGFAPQMAFGASWPLNTTNVPMLTNSIQSGPAAMDVDSTPPATTCETPAKRSDRRAREQ
ncbi:hypothetical protein BDZ94DRAFT_1308298 [Collybia nuda]|uniref:Uncharacterized protein n=1 Tax=Collybia nuda TaxID=64659 RepID=A0A9P6CFF2_9AGAR|nr:hypothetical protein BDZ94DRAFT_1308298 [Collybia nuda]